MGDCAQTAVYRLSDQKEGNAKIGTAKYRWAKFTAECGSVKSEGTLDAVLDYSFSLKSIFIFRFLLAPILSVSESTNDTFCNSIPLVRSLISPYLLISRPHLKRPALLYHGIIIQLRLD